MYPPLYDLCEASSGVQTIFGAAPRIYPAGDADANTTKPYAVQQTVSGSPDNYLAGAPDVDSFLVQVDVYGDTVESVTDGAEAIRDALEPAAYITRWGGVTREPNTRLYRYSFDVEFTTTR